MDNSTIDTKIVQDARKYLDRIKAFHERNGPHPEIPKTPAEIAANNLYLSRMPPLNPRYKGTQGLYEIEDHDIMRFYQKFHKK
ncbi:MAG: hypothetical protein ACLFPQ_02345 [Candidatus Woesearchaeota archaeon]